MIIDFSFLIIQYVRFTLFYFVLIIFIYFPEIQKHKVKSNVLKASKIQLCMFKFKILEHFLCSIQQEVSIDTISILMIFFITTLFLQQRKIKRIESEKCRPENCNIT
jgi:hypothetical protein